MPELTLVIVEGSQAGGEVSLTSITLIGRDPSVDLIIRDPDVSGRHASLVPLASGFAIEDLGSTNGTFVNGERLAAQRELAPGDQIQLGATVLEVRGTPASDIPAVQRTRVKQIPALPVLVFLAGQLQGTKLQAGAQLVVGRELGAADVILDRDEAVSRRHAAFSPLGAGSRSRTWARPTARSSTAAA